MVEGELSEKIETILKATRERKIPWRIGSLHYVRWIKSNEEGDFNITLRLREKGFFLGESTNNGEQDEYEFNIQSLTGSHKGENTLSIDSTYYPQLRHVLERLYKEAVIVAKEGGSIDFLSKIVKDL